MIDPLETVLAYLAAEPALVALVDTRIAAKHRYAETWTRGQSAIMVRLDGGPPELYVNLQVVRLEARCYAASQAEAAEIWRALVGVSRAACRESVPVTDGTALLHYLLQESGPSLLYDGEARMDFCLCFFGAAVSEDPVT